MFLFNKYKNNNNNDIKYHKIFPKKKKKTLRQPPELNRNNNIPPISPYTYIRRPRAERGLATEKRGWPCQSIAKSTRPVVPQSSMAVASAVN